MSNIFKDAKPAYDYRDANGRRWMYVCRQSTGPTVKRFPHVLQTDRGHREYFADDGERMFGGSRMIERIKPHASRIDTPCGKPSSAILNDIMNDQGWPTPKGISTMAGDPRLSDIELAALKIGASSAYGEIKLAQAVVDDIKTPLEDLEPKAGLTPPGMTQEQYGAYLSTDAMHPTDAGRALLQRRIGVPHVPFDMLLNDFSYAARRHEAAILRSYFPSSDELVSHQQTVADKREAILAAYTAQFQRAEDLNAENDALRAELATARNQAITDTARETLIAMIRDVAKSVEASAIKQPNDKARELALAVLRVAKKAGKGDPMPVIFSDCVGLAEVIQAAPQV